MKTIRILISIILIITIFGANVVLAANNYTLDLDVTEDKEQIQPGESIVFDVKVSNIHAGAGIVFFGANLNYNANVFDCKVEGDVSGKWSKEAFIDNVSLSMKRSDLEASSENAVVARITLTAKQNSSLGEYPLVLSRITFSTDDDQTIEKSDITKNIKIAINQNNNENQESNTGDNGNQNQGSNTGDNGNQDQGSNTGDNGSQNQESNTGDNGNQNQGNNIGNNEPQNINTDNSNNQNIQNNDEQNREIEATNLNENSNDDNLPYSGVEDQGIIIFLALSIVVAVVLYKKYKKFENI